MSKNHTKEAAKASKNEKAVNNSKKAVAEVAPATETAPLEAVPAMEQEVSDAKLVINSPKGKKGKAKAEPAAEGETEGTGTAPAAPAVKEEIVDEPGVLKVGQKKRIILKQPLEIYDKKAALGDPSKMKMGTEVTIEKIADMGPTGTNLIRVKKDNSHRIFYTIAENVQGYIDGTIGNAEDVVKSAPTVEALINVETLETSSKVSAEAIAEAVTETVEANAEALENAAL